MEINVGILVAQGINFLVILFLFKWLVGDKLSKAIQARRVELAKVENAEEEYQTLMAQGEEEKQKLISEGLAHKSKLVTEAEAVAKKREENIIDAANKKASQIEDSASHQAKQMKASIESEFEQTVKDATKIVVSKLVDTSPEIKKGYLEGLVKEFSASK